MLNYFGWTCFAHFSYHRIMKFKCSGCFSIISSGGIIISDLFIFKNTIYSNFLIKPYVMFTDLLKVYRWNHAIHWYLTHNFQVHDTFSVCQLVVFLLIFWVPNNILHGQLHQKMEEDFFFFKKKNNWDLFSFYLCAFLSFEKLWHPRLHHF